MERVNLEVVFNKRQEKELIEMKSIDHEVTKIFETIVPRVKGFDHAWLVKLNDKTIGYTDLVVEENSLVYYMDIAIKTGYRTKKIIVDVLKEIRKQALSSNIYLETGVDRNILEEAFSELEVDKIEEKNKRKVYNLNKK